MRRPRIPSLPPTTQLQAGPASPEIRWGPIEVDHFDCATVPYPWGTANTPVSFSTTAYDGNWTTSTDESGRVKKRHVDGLGRLDTVIEDPTSLNYQTTYTYDVGNNLTGVNQSGQTRTFIYDSLNRLLQARNPESNTTTYTYDPAGNLLTKTSPAPNQTGGKRPL